MQSLTVKYGAVTDALGRKREGWLIFEDGRPGYPYKDKDKAIRDAEALKGIRCAPHVQVKVIE
jgi:hypothetical protein